MMPYFRKFNKFLLFISLLSASCSHYIRPEPILSPNDYEDARCSIPFISGKWRFVHVVEADINKRNISMIGITVISSETETIQCVIMTIEGFVIFDAVYDQKLTINRGVAPFDSKAFAKGMIDDIRLIFLKPDGIMQSGMFNEETHVCRYKDDKNITITDVVTMQNKDWEIRQYKNLNLMRKVKAFMNENASHPENQMIPNNLTLTAYGDHPYALKLKLLEYEKIM